MYVCSRRDVITVECLDRSIPQLSQHDANIHT